MVVEVVLEIVARLPEDDAVGQQHEQEVDDDQDGEAVVCFMLISMVVDTIATIHCVCPSGKCVYKITFDTWLTYLYSPNVPVKSGEIARRLTSQIPKITT